MRRWAIFLLFCISSTLCAGKGREFTLQLTPEQWQEIGDPADFDDDLLVMNTGEKVWGRVKNVPTLHYSFGKVEFTLEEVAGLSFADSSKMQIITRNGQNFLGSMPEQPLNFEIRHVTQEKPGLFTSGEKIEYIAKRVPPTTVNFILFKQRGSSEPLIHKRFHSVVLANGDRFPIIIATDVIQLTDGWTDSTLDPKDIVDVQFKGGLQGYIRGEGLDTELRFSFVKDKFLPALLAKSGDELKIPWSQIARIRGDMGEFILTTPYQFTPRRPTGMVYIPPGKFIMGPKEPLMQVVLASEQGQASRGALGGLTVHRKEAIARGMVPTQTAPSYAVEMPGFYIDQHEVTNSEYLQFVTDTGHPVPQYWIRGKPPQGLEDHPVVCVTYADAESYATWAGKRIPTEVEWERAAKGGAGTAYSYGDTYVNGLSNVESTETRPVGSYAAATARFGVAINSTVQGVVDMTGNVAEWTSSPFKSLTPDEPNQVYRYKRMVPTYSTALKVVRGGAFSSTRFTATTTHRASLHERDFNNYTGFRCVADDPSATHSASGKRE